MSQIGNALKMLVLLQSRRQMKIKDIAQELEVDERSIRRYKDDLEQAGIYIFSQKGKYGGYYLGDNNYLLNLGVSNSEFYSLQLVDKFLQDSSHITAKDIRSVLRKIEAVEKKKEHLHQNIANHMEKTSISASNTDEIRNMLLDFHSAILLQKKINIQYGSLRSGLSERIICPYATFEYSGEFYFVGYCENRKLILDFKLCRVKKYEILKDSFVKEDFELEEYMQNCFGVFKDEELAIKLKIHGDMAQIISEKIWVPNQKITKIDNGEVIFEAKMRGIVEIVNWVLSMKGEAVVLEPKKLVDEVTKAAMDVLKMYENLNKT